MMLNRLLGLRSSSLLWLLTLQHPAFTLETARFSNSSSSSDGSNITPAANPTTEVKWTEAPLSLTTITIDILPNVSVNWYGGPIPGTDLQAPGFIPTLTRPTHLVTSYMSPLRPTFNYYTGTTTVEITGSTVTTAVLTLEIDPGNTVDLTKEWNGTQTTYIGPSYRDTTIVLSGPTSIVTVAIIGNKTVVSPPFALQTVDSLLRPPPTPRPSPAAPLPESTDSANLLESQTALALGGEETTETSRSTYSTQETATVVSQPALVSEGATETTRSQSSTPEVAAIMSLLSQLGSVGETEQADGVRSTSTESLVGIGTSFTADAPVTTDLPAAAGVPPTSVTGELLRSNTESGSPELDITQNPHVHTLPSVTLSGSSMEVSPIDSTRVLVGTVTASLDHNTIYISSMPIATLPAVAMSQIATYTTSEAPIGSYIWQALGGSPIAAGSAEVTRIGSASVAGETGGAGSSQAVSGFDTSPPGADQTIATGNARSFMADCSPIQRVLLGFASYLALSFSEIW